MGGGRSIAVLVVLLAAIFGTPPALGSEIIDRNVSRATLAIDSGGRAHVSYRARGRTEWVVAWGAINARVPSRSRPQVAFKLRYGVRGGSGVCRPYDGPALAFLVKACTAPDGSYWALQSWQRLKPNYGGKQGAWELHLSHWRGPLARLAVYENWTGNGYRHIFGRLTYRGRGVYGFDSTPRGAPRDGYGRNIYLDTYDSAYGRGWHRENGFLTHHRGRSLGDFCYGFFPHSAHPSGEGTRYRAMAEGPGVTPDVLWTAADVGTYDPAGQRRMLSLLGSWGDPKCSS
jgi:hypothetical protein